MSAFDDYLQLLNNNPKMDVTKNAFNNWLDTTKNTISNSLPPTNGDPSALIDWAANSTPTGLAGNILAWHGSPHKFTKFEDRAIGSGEGNQAFGMGHYSGEHINALDYQYRKYLSQLKNDNQSSALDAFKEAHKPELDSLYNRMLEEAYSLYPKDLINPHSIDSNPYTALHGSSQLIEKIFESAQNAKRGIIDKSWQNGAPAGISKGLGAGMGDDLYEKALAYKVPKTNDKGYLYQLNLKPNKEDLLHFNKAISKQDPKIIDSYVNAMKSLGLDKNADIALSSNLKGRDAYNNLIKVTGSSTNTSKLLNDFGIPGHAFAGQGGKGLDNYVMYNPDDIEIVRRISAGLENPRDSFKRYPNTVHRAVNDYNVDSGTIDPKTIDSLLNELSNSGLKKLKFW